MVETRLLTFLLSRACIGALMLAGGIAGSVHAQDNETAGAGATILQPLTVYASGLPAL